MKAYTNIALTRSLPIQNGVKKIKKKTTKLNRNDKFFKLKVK